jgi:hypothetical protein
MTATIETLPPTLRTPATALVPIAVPFSANLPATINVYVPPAGERIFITSIVFSVTEQCTIQFFSGSKPLSGPLFFGAETQPKAAAIDHSRIPLTLEVDQPFMVKAEGTGKIGGYCILYTLPELT